jgi:hypothetical protein
MKRLRAIVGIALGMLSFALLYTHGTESVP